MKICKGNISSFIDCNDLIRQVQQHTVEPYHGLMDLSPGDQFYEDYLYITQLAQMAGYNEGDSVEFRHYNAGEHFDQSIADQFSKFLNAKQLLCWVSEIRPGKCAPWHWDILPWEHEWKKLGNLVRYFCFISPPTPGHVFLVEDECFYFEEQGTVYQYPNLYVWHAGSNVGFSSKYLLTFTGYQ